MQILKKLFFTIPFLFLFTLFLIQFKPILENPNIILSLDIAVLYVILQLVVFLLAFELCFALFVLFSADFRYIVPTVLLTTVPVIFIFPMPYNYILALGTLVSFGGVYVFLREKLLTYINFHATELLLPSIKQLSTLILLTLTISFYFSSQEYVKQSNISQIFKPFIDTAVSIASSQFSAATTTIPAAETVDIPTLSDEQINLLKQNPQLLRQYGIDPKILDTINQPQKEKQSTSVPPIEGIIRSQLETQLEQMLKPYQDLFAPVLAFLFFITLLPLASLLSLFLHPILWLLFMIFEKSGFAKFVVETRQVRKLVV